MNQTVRRALMALAALAAWSAPGRAQAPPEEVLPPAWTSDGPGGHPLYVDAERAVVAQAADLRAFDLATGKLAWSLKLDQKPTEAGACREFVAVRAGAIVRCYDPRSGAEIFKVDGASGMQVVGKRLVCSRGSTTQLYDPLAPKVAPKTVAFVVPFQRSTDPTRGARLDRRVVWRAAPETLAAFDLDSFTIAWKSEWQAFRYIAIPDAAVIGLDKGAKPTPVTAWDELHGYYTLADLVAIHASRLLEVPKSTGVTPRGEYLWFVEGKKGGGTRLPLERAATDHPDPPVLSWAPGTPKPYFVARWAGPVAGEFRFDLYAGAAGRSSRSGYLPYDSLVPGAKGQLVATRGTDPSEFCVLAMAKLAPVWTGRGLPVARGPDEAAPYLALRYAAATNTTHLDQLDIATGATLATVPLGRNRWEAVSAEPASALAGRPVSWPLLFRGQEGELVRIETGPLAISHRFLLAGLSEKMYAIDATSILVRPGDRLARVDFAPRPPK